MDVVAVVEVEDVVTMAPSLVTMDEDDVEDNAGLITHH